MKRTALLSASVVALVAGGCSSEPTDEPPAAVESTEQSPTSAATSDDEPASIPAGIPDGTYAQSWTRDAAIAAGYSPDIVEAVVPPDGTTFTYRLEDGRFTHFVLENGIDVPGDIGSYTYDDEGRWVNSSESDGCPGCVQAFSWTVEGDVLTLRLEDVNYDADSSQPLASGLEPVESAPGWENRGVAFIVEGEFRRVE